MDLSQLDAHLDAEAYTKFKIGVFDIDGVFRGKYVDREKFRSAAEKGFGFCDVVLGWDSNDQLYEGVPVAVSGWHTGYRDAPVALDLSTVRRLPFEPDTLLAIGAFTGDYAAVCPRTLFSRTVARARAAGFEPSASAEYEFFVFEETPRSVREKGYRGLTPLTPGFFGYSVLRSTVHHELYHELIDGMAALGVPVEGLHTETGAGVLEAAIRYTHGVDAADRAALFKTFTKVICQRRGLMATFMAKCTNEFPGQSGHLHVSLARDGVNAFYDGRAPDEMSDTMRHFLAGQVALLPELLPMVCSTVNSYRRMVPGMWAPTTATWGIENRTTALRAIPAGKHGTRTEYRIAPADANPYLAMAAALGSGLWGIEHRMELPPAIQGSAYDDASAPQLPGSLAEATAAFRRSDAARALFGDAFVEHFAATREWEDRQARKWVSDWDLARYFEII